MLVRILFVLLRLFGLGAIVRFIQATRARLVGHRQPLPRFPPELRGRGERTWVVFTQGDDPASKRVLDRIAALDPNTDSHAVDLRREPVLARAFRVTGAPSVFLVGADGSVRARLGDGTGLANFVSRPG